MNLPHVHLLLNHFPTIGFGVGLALFIVALVTKSNDLKRAGLGIFFVMGLLTIAAYISGKAAEEAIQGREGVSAASTAAHEDAAFFAFVLMEITGFLAWIGLWEYRRISALPGWNAAAVLVLAILTFGLMENAANIGGEIRHPEILAVPDSGGEPAPTLVKAIGAYVTDHSWVWPTCETLHFIGLSLLFTVVLLIDLRLLRMAKSLSFASLYQLLPWGMLGFAINLVTGMMFFFSTPEQYTQNISFYWKIAFLLLAGINALYFMYFDETWSVGPGDDAPLRAKFVAATTIFL